MRATDTTNERRYLDERGAALGVRSIGAPFYKRRPTPKPSLDLRCNNRRFFAQRLCRCLPRFGRKHAAAIADLSQILPQTYRRRIADVPSVSRAPIVWRAVRGQCLARELRSTLHRARSASGRLVGLRAGEDRCRQATRGTVEKRVQHKIRNFAQPKLNAQNHSQHGQNPVSVDSEFSVSCVLVWLP